MGYCRTTDMTEAELLNTPHLYWNHLELWMINIFNNGTKTMPKTEVLVRKEEITAITEESSSEQLGKNEALKVFDTKSIFYTLV